MIDEIKDNINAAQARLNLIDDLIEDENYVLVASNLYYACFYYLRALLITKDAEYTTHKGVIIGFNKFFVKEGIAPRKLSKFIGQLAAARFESDYDLIHHPRELIDDFISGADEFTAFAEEYLKPYLEDK